MNGGWAKKLVPYCSAGDASVGQRVGEWIHPTSGIIKGFINFKDYNVPATSTTGPSPSTTLMVPTYIKMWIVDFVNPRVAFPFVEGTELNLANFLIDSEGQATSLSGTMYDLMYHVNPRLFRVRASKLIKLSANTQVMQPHALPLVTTTTTATAANPLYQGLQAVGGSGEFSKSFYFDYSKFLKKKLQYTRIASGAPTYPINQGLLFIVSPIYASGTQMADAEAPANTLGVEIHFTDTKKFTDT